LFGVAAVATEPSKRIAANAIDNVLLLKCKRLGNIASFSFRK
jgi:hypothetical protein